MHVVDELEAEKGFYKQAEKNSFFVGMDNGVFFFC